MVTDSETFIKMSHDKMQKCTSNNKVWDSKLTKTHIMEKEKGDGLAGGLPTDG